MNLATTLIASAAVLLGIGACAAPADEDGEDIGSTQQALCRRGTCDVPPFPPGSSGGVLAPIGGNTLDPGTPATFTCKGTGKNCLDPGYLTLSCNPENANDCVCMQGCGGGGWSFGTYNGCPLATHRYGCNALGSCRCY